MNVLVLMHLLFIYIKNRKHKLYAINDNVCAMRLLFIMRVRSFVVA